MYKEKLNSQLDSTVLEPLFTACVHSACTFACTKTKQAREHSL